MNTLATSKWFYTHGWETLLIIGILFILIGLICGRILWKLAKNEVATIEQRNEELSDHYDKLEKSHQKVSKFVDDLS